MTSIVDICYILENGGLRMDIFLDKGKLIKLLKSFHVVTGLKFGMYDTNFKELFTTADESSFCKLIHNTRIGLAKCDNCDAKAFKIARQHKDTFTYRCHAGILESCAPIIENEEVIAYLIYGQILDETSYDTQWRDTLEKCNWYSDVDLLKANFFNLERFSNEKLVASEEIMSACTAYIWLRRVVQSYKQTDAQRLVAYIDHNFEKDITLDTIATSLKMSKTKLCIMAKAVLNSTVGQLIAHKRFEISKIDLQTTDLSISEICAKVGISDYNYFSRWFRIKAGLTPTQFRAKYRNQ